MAVRTRNYGGTHVGMDLGAFSVSLNVADPEASRRFYEALGFTQFHGALVRPRRIHVLLLDLASKTTANRSAATRSLLSMTSARKVR